MFSSTCPCVTSSTWILVLGLVLGRPRESSGSGVYRAPTTGYRVLSILCFVLFRIIIGS
jgi:hypothetical protein